MKPLFARSHHHIRSVQPRDPLLNSKGFSLVEVLVATGILAILTAGIATLLNSQNKEIRSMSERVAATDLQRVLQSTLGSGNSCVYALNNPTPLTFNSLAPFPQTLDLGAQSPPRVIYSYVGTGTPPLLGPKLLEVGMPASAVSNAIVTKGIKLEITSGAGNKYMANWIIDLDETKTVRASKAVRVSTVLTVDTTVPTAATIVGCLDSGPPAAQAWTPVARSNGVAYQNTESSPIQVKVSATGFATWAYLYLYLSTDGSSWVLVDRATCFDTGTVSATVPAGHYYRAEMGGFMGGARAIVGAAELR